MRVIHGSCRDTLTVVGVVVCAALVASADPTGPVIESTGFEASEGWNTGFICDPTMFTNCLGPPLPEGCTGDPIVDGNCCVDNPNPYTGWFTSISSEHCDEPHIDTTNPDTGSQHLRFIRDERGGDPPGCVGFDSSCRISAFTPTAGGPLPPGPTTISYRIAQGAESGIPPWGSSFRYWGIPDAGGDGESHYFSYYGVAYFYDYGLGQYYAMGYTSGSGVYDTVQVHRDPCNDTVTYSFNGLEFQQSAGMSGMEAWISRAILLHDNNVYHWDFDDYSIVRDACPATSAIEVFNGHNGPFPGIHTFGDQYSRLFRYVADSPYTSVNTCGSNRDTEIWWGFDEGGNFVGYMNNDCVSTGETGDPTAPCADGGTESCLCVPTVPGEEYIFVVYLLSEPPAPSVFVNINKKVASGEPIPKGACCDGLTGDCTDGIAVEECACDQCSWFEGRSCSAVYCEPDAFPVPTLSWWGLAVLVILMLAGTALALSKRGHLAAAPPRE